MRITFLCQVNTALQLVLMGSTTISPLLAMDVVYPLQMLQYVHSCLFIPTPYQRISLTD